MAERRTISFVISSEIDDELDQLAATTGQSKPDLARNALIEWLEDQEDIRDAEAIIAQNEPTVSLDEVRRELGLAG
jgi:predicted transcriptional regulator